MGTEHDDTTNGDEQIRLGAERGSEQDPDSSNAESRALVQESGAHVLMMHGDMEGESPLPGQFDCRTICHAPTKESFLRRVPIINTIATYKTEYILGDIVAGITVGVMLVPQGMAYALLANLPPQYGLYSSVVPIMIYALFGTSKQLAVGPVAIVALLISEAIESQGLHTDEDKVQFAFVLAFMVGLLSALLGLIRAGLLSTFLSHSVLVGFTGGAAVVIALSQLKHLLGFDIPKSPFPIETLFYALGHLGDTNPATVTMGIVGIVILFGLRVVKRKWTAPVSAEAAKGRSPGSVRAENIARKVLAFVCSMSALEVVILGTVVTTYMYRERGYTNETLPIVGDVPSGFPAPSVPELSTIGNSFGNVFVTALVITILGFMESFAVADRYSRKLGYSVDANQELVALGLANLFGSFFNSFPVTGGFSRTAVNEGSGANTPVASLISSLIVLFVVLLLTSLFYFMPKNILAAIVFVAVSSLFDFHAVTMSWKVARSDFWVIVTTFLATVCLGTEIGLAIGFGASVLLLLHQLAFPHMAVLAPVESGATRELLFRNVERFPRAVRIPGVLIFRVDASFNFANKTNVLDRLYKEIDATDFSAASEYSPGVVLSCEGINSVDVSGLEALVELRNFLVGKGASLVAASVKGPVRDAIDKQNEYAKHHGLAQLLPWPRKAASGSTSGEVAFPASFMVASIDEGLQLLRRARSSSSGSTEVSHDTKLSIL